MKDFDRGYMWGAGMALVGIAISFILFPNKACAQVSWQGSPLNYQNSELNYKNSSLSYDNSPLNYKNSELNYDSKNRVYDNSGNQTGYVTNNKGTANYYNNSGSRINYVEMAIGAMQ